MEMSSNDAMKKIKWHSIHFNLLGPEEIANFYQK